MAVSANGKTDQNSARKSERTRRGRVFTRDLSARQIGPGWAHKNLSVTSIRRSWTDQQWNSKKTVPSQGTHARGLGCQLTYESNSLVIRRGRTPRELQYERQRDGNREKEHNPYFKTTHAAIGRDVGLCAATCDSGRAEGAKYRRPGKRDNPGEKKTGSRMGLTKETKKTWFRKVKPPAERPRLLLQKNALQTSSQTKGKTLMPGKKENTRPRRTNSICQKEVKKKYNKVRGGRFLVGARRYIPKKEERMF